MSLLLDGLELPDELIWQDEHEWTLVRASTKRTIQGKHIVRQNVVPSEAGRYITLASDYAWIPRVTVGSVLGVEEIRDWSDTIGKEMVLTMHDSRVYVVRFRHWEPPVLGADLLIPTAFPEDKTQYNLLLRLAVI